MKKSVELKKFNNFNSNGIKNIKFYNFFPKNELNPAFSIVPAEFPSSLEGGNYSQLNTPENVNYKGITSLKQYFPNNQSSRYRIIVYGDDKKVYLNQLFTGSYNLYWLYEMTFDSPPITLSYKNDDQDAIILTSKEKMMIWKTNFSPYDVENVPIITSMCMNDGVLFCTIKEPAFKVWYATDLDAENIGNIGENSDYISLEDDLGDARKIIAFDGDVFVFRDYGISKISYLQKSITVSQIYSSNSKIIANSVSQCGNSVIFLTFDGLYTFNGVKVNKLDFNFHTLLDGANNGAVASSLGNYYYLALRLNFNDENKTEIEKQDYVNNAIVIIDITDNNFQIIRGVDTLALHPLRTEAMEKMLLISNTTNTDKIFEIVQNRETEYFNNLKYFESSELIENHNLKLINKLVVDGSKDVNYSLKFDNGKTLTFTSTNNGVTTFNFRLTCKKVSLKIESNNNGAYVNKVELEYYDY